MTVTNNIIANNVAGWDGGGVSMQDALKVTFVNNTVASNDTTASAGVLFKTLGAINRTRPPPGCTPKTDPSLPQDPSCTGANAPARPAAGRPGGEAHTPNLIVALTGCWSRARRGGLRLLGYGVNGDCRKLSKPSDGERPVLPEPCVPRRHHHCGHRTAVAAEPGGAVAAVEPDELRAQCPAGANYWDVGLRTDDIDARLIPAGHQADAGSTPSSPATRRR